MEDLIDSLDEEGSMDRASAWVLRGAEEAASLRSYGEADAGHDPSDAGSDQSAAPDTASVIDASSVQSFHPVTVPAVDTSDTVPMVAAGHVPAVIPDSMSPVGVWGRVGQAPPMQEDGVVRTRVGRVVGKVNRLKRWLKSRLT